MGRIRSIKPEFSHSEAIVALPRDVRLHFIQLWTYADDHGRGKDEPRVIKGAIWPLDDDVTPEMVEAWQCVLAEHGRIVRYTVDGRQFFEVTNWHEHQKPNRRTDSKIVPADQGVPVVAVQAQCVSSASAVQAHREFSAVGGGVEVEGGGEGDVEGESCSNISPQLPVVGDEPQRDVEQLVNRAVGLLANLRAVGGDNPAGLAVHIGKTLPDHERTELRELIAGGMEPRDAAAALADPLRGMAPPSDPRIDPAAVAAAADRARKREAESAAKLTEMREAATERAPMPADLRKRLHAVPAPVDQSTPDPNQNEDIA